MGPRSAGWARPARLLLLAAATWAAGCGGDPGATTPTPGFSAVEHPGFQEPGATVDAWADVDGDGDPDRLVGMEVGPARLYRNDGLGGFTEVAAAAGLATAGPVTTAAWGDYDRDGDPDLLLGLEGSGEPRVALYRNDGGAFTPVAGAAGMTPGGSSPREAVWVDVDADGDLDLFLAVPQASDRLWRNDGGAFTDVTGAAGLSSEGGSAAAAFLDADADGDLDLVTVDAATNAARLLRREGGLFRSEPLAPGAGPGVRRPGAPGRSVCVADLDGDGRPDLHLAGTGRSRMLRNPGRPEGRWREVTAELGLERVLGPACAWGDVDHDGRPELVASGADGTPVLHRPGEGTAEAPGPRDGTAPEARRVRLLDADGDGDLELATRGAAAHPLFRNLLRPEFAGDALRIRVLDAEGRATRAGAVVRLLVPGSRSVVATGVVEAGGAGSQSDLPVHLGVPGGQPVTVEVVTPAPGGPDTTSLGPVDPMDHRGRVLEVRTRSGAPKRIPDGAAPAAEGG